MFLKNLLSIGSLFRDGRTSAGRIVRTLHNAGTFNCGRNDEKRRARAIGKKHREAYVGIRNMRALRAPKRNSPPEVEMLANRRLRQIRGTLTVNGK